ncbi:MAG: hypothetical protein PHR38_01225 [Bacteroidales bacterium]|nr:hypothetical protein [Bacteroidales bacterium]MDD3906730.1 hypothetical protein [Bacteroidales bacterium]MDD4711907.1 hypothetical protein [Bacteroidales bacterium]
MIKILSERYQSARWLFLLLFLISAGCDGFDSSIPDAYVYVKRDINATKLNEPNTTCYISKSNLANEGLGYGGIIIVHAFDGEYYAFDLSCPVEHKSDIRIGYADQSLNCKCDSCGEEYELGFGLGTPKNHKSKEALRRYKVKIINNDIIVTR